MSFIDINSYWKKRFSNDVLIEIDKKFRWIGVDCNIHTICDCVDKIPCFYCYLYNECYHHEQYEYISFDTVKKECYAIIDYRYMPIETFLYMFENYEYAGRYINSIKSQLEYFINNKQYKLKTKVNSI